ncbi:MAG: ABC transporter ATP-binding protein [Chloroflexi bacterium]|nr:MAG: ABC transporter ATP-binding protein [Chloroflexota bacterium]
MASVRFEHINKSFGNVEVVHDLSLTVEDHEFVVLVGPSGSGKSTILRLVAGLDAPSGGQLYIGDRLVNGVEPKDRDIAMVFQSYALYPQMDVSDNIAFSLQMHHVPKKEREEKVQQAARMLGLQEYLQRKPRELSGGQRQRVALGRAIVREPQVFLMDEPLSNLDAQLRVATRAEIIDLHQRIPTTTIYVTHDQAEAMTMGNRVAVLSGGLIQQFGTPHELYEHPTNLFVAGFIGSPAMNFVPGATVVSEDGGAKVLLEGIGQVVVPQPYVEQARQAASLKLTFGIRPPHLEDVNLIPPEEQTGSVIEGQVKVVEYLGDQLQVYLTAGGIRMVAMLSPRSHVSVGGTVRLHIENEQMHLFDTETGKALF